MERISESGNPEEAIAASYLRVASKYQGDQASGVTAQRDACEQEAKRVGVRIAAEFMDMGVSGNTTNRPGLDRLLAFIRRRPVTYLIVSDHSRLARNYRDDLVVRQAIKQAGATVVSVDKGIDQAALGPLLDGVVNAFAEFASIDRRYV